MPVKTGIDNKTTFFKLVFTTSTLESMATDVRLTSTAVPQGRTRVYVGYSKHKLEKEESHDLNR